MPDTGIVIKHGTYSGWNAHQRYQITVCDDCRAAHSAYMRERRKTNQLANQMTLWDNRTRRRAQTLLTHRYASEFKKLLDQVRREDPPPHH